MNLTTGFFTLIVFFTFIVIFALWLGDRVKTGFRFRGAELFLSYERREKKARRRAAGPPNGAKKALLGDP